MNRPRQSARRLATYSFFVWRSRWERRSEWVLRWLQRYLPARFRERPLLVLGTLQLVWLCLESAAVAGIVFGLARAANSAVMLSLLFASLVLIGASTGLSVVHRTVAPPDEERLLLAPIPDREAYSLVFFGHAAPQFVERTVLIPLVAGLAASAGLGGSSSPPLLWGAVAVSALMGLSLALVANRIFGRFVVRRTQKGARGLSVAAYVLSSAVALGFGWLAARVLAPWMAAFPRERGTEDQWLLAFPTYVAETVSDATTAVVGVLVNEMFATGALARATLGDTAGLAVATLWMVPVALLAFGMLSRGGRWYRDEWRSAWQGWVRGDLFDLAERLYVGLARTVHRRDVLLRVQIRNLCRSRDKNFGGVFDLFGGALPWVSVGLAAGAAPVLRGSSTAAAVFALLIGLWEGTESYRGPFVYFKESLAVDAERRQAGLYRASGTSLRWLYRAKVRTGRLASTPSLAFILVLMVALGGLPPACWPVLLSAAIVGWSVGPHIELLPGLVSPHFAWDHADEIGDHYDQEHLSAWARNSLVALWIAAVAMVLLLLGGRISPTAFPWVATCVLLLFACVGGFLFERLGRRAARIADRMDMPA